MKHKSTPCVRDTRLTYYCGKSWKGTFRCPACGAEGTINLNYLGHKGRVTCDGSAHLHITREVKE